MSYSEEHRYDDIINLPHPVSTKHPRMALPDRAAQFSPFAALSGHEEAIRETARLTDGRMELDESSKELLDVRLQVIRAHLTEKPEVTVTFFEPDKKKCGGMYVTVTGCIKKIDEYAGKIVLEGGISIFMADVTAIESELFCEGEGML